MGERGNASTVGNGFTEPRVADLKHAGVAILEQATWQTPSAPRSMADEGAPLTSFRRAQHSAYLLAFATVLAPRSMPHGASRTALSAAVSVSNGA